MTTNRWRVLAGAAIAIAMALPVSGANTIAPEGLFPTRDVGGMIAIPGAPLPKVPVSSVATAIRIYEPFLAGIRFFGDTPAVARGVGYLATLHAAIGDYEKAERLFDDAQQIIEQYGSPASDLAWVHNNRGLVQLETGQYASGVRSFRTAVALLARARSDDLEPRVKTLQNLATAYSLLGDHENSEGAYLDAIDVLRNMHKEGTRSHQVTRGNLALLYATMGDHAAARDMLDVLVAEKGLNDSSRFQTLINLGYVLAALKKFPEAEARLLQAQALSTEGSAERAMVLMNLSAMYAWAENFEHAEAVAEEALPLVEHLYGADSRMAAAVKANMGTTALSRGEVLKADRLLVEARRGLAVGSGDEEAYMFATRALALVAQRRGQQKRAAQLSREALDLSKKHLERILAFGSEAQRLAYLNQASPFDQLANLGDASLLAEAVLTIKGAVLESLLAERALTRQSRSPADQEQLDRIHALKVEIMEKIGRGEAGLDALERALKKEETALAQKLAPQLRRARPPVDPDRIRATLDSDQVLIEIVRYQRYADGGKLVPAYGGIIIPRSAPLKWVALDDAAPIDRAIAALVAKFSGPGRGAERADLGGDITPVLRDLHDRLWQPLAQTLPNGTREILLSPDAATSFLPWTVLLDSDERFVAERWQLTEISAGRDLLRPASAGRAKTFLAFADGRGDLPFSRQEVGDVARAAEKYEWRTAVFVGERALEQELLRHPRPRVLHLATHGGQLGGKTASSVQNRLSRNPMYRGYLLLGGGEATLESWKRGSAAAFAVDGILTAEEASVLDLSETWLTVLSACETGAGDARMGEGVLGLRRGFALAGSQNLLFSLWRVRDDATAALMKSFYERMFCSGDPSGAFHQTQLAELLRWKEQLGITGAVYRAGGFVLMQQVR